MYGLGDQIGKNSSYANTTSTRGISVATAASANTLSANWVELIASAAQDADGFFIVCHISSTHEVMLNLAVGANPNETAFLTNFLINRGLEANKCMERYFIPLPIRKGDRISAKTQSPHTSAVTLYTSIRLVTNSMCSTFGSCEAIGANASTTRGVDITPGLSNVKGDWISIGTLTRAAKAITICTGCNETSQSTSYGLLIDVAVNASPNPIIIVPDILFYRNFATMAPSSLGPLSIDIPAASELMVRAQSSNATGYNFDVCAYCFS